MQLLDSLATLNQRNTLGSVIAEVTKDIFIPITVGGRIKNIEQARNLLLSGADKLAINTAALESPSTIDELVKNFGSQAVVASSQIKRIESIIPTSIYSHKEKVLGFQFHPEGSRPAGLRLLRKSIEHLLEIRNI